MKSTCVTTGQLSRFGAVALIVSVLVLRPTPAQPEGHYPIPAEVLASAREYAISKVGETFFESYMTWNPALSCFRPLDPRNLTRSSLRDWLQCPRYIIIYNLRIPEKPYVDEIVYVNIKEDGGWFEDLDPRSGLPDCVSHPGECEFPIDREASIEIAKEAGLQPGTKPWEADFRWHGPNYNTYAWYVRNTLGDMHGEAILIDGNSGAVLHSGEWRVVVA